MEAVSPYPCRAPRWRNSIGMGVFGHVVMESGVEDRDVAHAGPTLTGQAYAGQCGRIVMRRQSRSLADLAFDFFIHEHRVAQQWATVCDAVTNAIERCDTRPVQVPLDLLEGRSIHRRMINRRVDQWQGRADSKTPNFRVALPALMARTRMSELRQRRSVPTSPPLATFIRSNCQVSLALAAREAADQPMLPML